MRGLLKKRRRWLLLVLPALAAALVWALWAGLTVRCETLYTDKLTNPVRLVLLTDLHSTLYGNNQKRLIRLVAEQNPDAVLLAGDIFDDEAPHRGAELLLEALGQLCPCFYAAGNHEFWAENTGEIFALLRACGVTVLQGDGVKVKRGGQLLQIFGVDDPEGFGILPGEVVPAGWVEQLRTCQAALEKGVCSILLSHRPELTEFYWDSGFDLVVSGHAHGGQVRLPGIWNGLYAPGQGWFPAYAGGLYQLGDTALVVSRGLSRNPRLPRVFNPPEVVVIDMIPAA